MAFKQDQDFLRFVTMGAAGGAHAAKFLADEHGHRIVELERYAMANKLWPTKLKRVRVPDLVCLDCGLRIEARAKSDLKIRLSDSDAPDREWDQGLRDRDLVALVAWDAENEVVRPNVEVFTIGALRATYGLSELGPRKSPSEGAERDRTWKASVPKRGGQVLEVDPAEQRVKTQLDSGRRQTYRIDPARPAYIYVEPGDVFSGGDTFLLGVVHAASEGDLDCPGQVWDEREDLGSSDDVTRYTAVKAAGYREDAEISDALWAIAYDSRIRLEAFASLARVDPATYTPGIISVALDAASDDPEALKMAMEALFILAELGTQEAADALQALAADRSLPTDARCAAVWGLGIAGVSRPSAVLDYIADEDEDVALHALAGVGPLDATAAASAAELLASAESERVGISVATLLAEQEELGADLLLDVAGEGGDAAVWALAGLGQMTAKMVRAMDRGRLTADVERALLPSWAVNESWLRQQEMDSPLRFLKRQTIRHTAIWLEPPRRPRDRP